MESLSPVDELLNAEIPPVLWHYTSFHGFYGVVRSRTIFATDIRFLNDRKEFVHAREIASEVVAECPEVGERSFPMRDYLEQAVNLAFDTGPLTEDRLQVFVACFSASEDQLSQWRGYSHGSSGVSLGFRLAALRPPVGVDTLVCFAPCVYKPAEKKALLSHSLAYFVKEVQAHWDATYEAASRYDGPRNLSTVRELERKVSGQRDFKSRLASALTKTRADLLRAAALIKDESFAEEAEWRLVLPVLTGKENMQNPPRFREGTTTLIPYIAYPLPNSDASTLPLVDMILGPGSHQSAIQAAFAFLRSEGVRVMPRESKVPYRPL